MAEINIVIVCVEDTAVYPLGLLFVCLWGVLVREHLCLRPFSVFFFYIDCLVIADWLAVLSNGDVFLNVFSCLMKLP